MKIQFTWRSFKKKLGCDAQYGWALLGFKSTYMKAFPLIQNISWLIFYAANLVIILTISQQKILEEKSYVTMDLEWNYWLDLQRRNMLVNVSDISI